MENLKIRVNSEAESKEVQGLLEKLGFKKSVWGTYSDYFIFANSNYYSRDDIPNFSECDYKEITLPDLRDLVVLKRNDVGDATHYTEECGARGFLTSDGIEYFWDYALKEWNKHKQSNFMEYQMKPIEKKEMKEYLRKNSNGTYSYIGTVRPEHVSDFMIEIPEGATKLVSHGYVHLPIMFVKPCANGYSYCYLSGIWSDTILSDIKGRDIFWSRHTHPEELPFIDDEPPQSLNDQYAEIETVRQHNHYFKDVSSLNEIDVYMVLKLFNVTDPCLQHIAKKALCAGQRGHKNFNRDLRDILDTAKRAVEINNG